jgi:hypothetical protein
MPSGLVVFDPGQIELTFDDLTIFGRFAMP